MSGKAAGILEEASSERLKQNFRQATELLNIAIGEYKDAEDLSGLSEAYLQTGDLFNEIGDFEKALENYFNFHSIAKERGDSKLLLRSYHKIGSVYQSIRDFDAAKNFFGKACRHASELDDQKEYSEALFALGNVYNWADELENAEKFLLESLKVAESLNDEKTQIRPISSLAILYTKMKKLDLSLDYFNKGIELSTKFGMLQIRAGMLKSLGNLYISRKEYEKAISTLKVAEKESAELRLNNILLLIHGFFADAYEKTGEYKLALEHHRKHLYYEKELMAEEVNLKTKGLQVKFELEEARRENEINLQRNIELEEANKEINRQKSELEIKNKNITDSIVYAERIQRAMLPELGILKEKYPESFVMYQPRDIVSGDFYWFYQVSDKFVIAVVDCTGHGVPGALMSMIGNDLLNHIVVFQNITDPSEILYRLNKGVKDVLRQRESESRDGMDIAVCVIDDRTKVLQYAGANNAAWIENGGRLEVLPATKVSIGGLTPDQQPFKTTVRTIVPGDRLYLFTDGFADQFGGPYSKKFKYHQLKELLVASSNEPIGKQYGHVVSKFNSWRGENEQVDDICIIGIQL